MSLELFFIFHEKRAKRCKIIGFIIGCLKVNVELNKSKLQYFGCYWYFFHLRRVIKRIDKIEWALIFILYIEKRVH